MRFWHASSIAATSYRRVAFVMGILLALCTLWAVSGPFRSHTNWMYFEQDDFFYYLKVAQNVAAGKGSTFNGLVPTNGYHPLWMLTLAAVLRSGAGPQGIMVFLACSIWVATLASYLLCLRLFRRAGLAHRLTPALAAFVAVYCMHLFTEGMEVTLAVPFMLAVLVSVQSLGLQSAAQPLAWRQGLWLGLLVSFMVLSRLDTIIFAAMLALGLVLQPSLRRRMNLGLLLGIAMGLLPIMLYLLINEKDFGTLLPVSGMAKELKLQHGFTAKSWRTFTELTISQWINIVGICVAIAAFPLLWKGLKPWERAMAFAALLFPLVYFTALSWLSEWRLWGWYFYSLRPAFALALVVLFRSTWVARAAAWRPAVAVFFAVTLYRMFNLQWDQQTPTLADAAQQLRTFAQTHPGIYAMGDRSGTAGYLVPEPMVQTEGLMMDKQFLQAIQQQEPLRQVLARYHVRYYVATSWQPYSGCFEAVEPWQAGPHSAHMRGEFCQSPLAHWTHDGVETLVFDLDAAPGA